MPIRIFNNQNSVKLDIRKISKYLPYIEKKMFLSKTDNYSIIFVNDENIRKLNKKFRHTARPTDVLSFPPEAGHLLADKNSDKDADIFISAETAKYNAKFYRMDFYTEILRLIIHGILHARGHTDYSEKAKKKMWFKQEQVLKCIMQ